MNFAEKMHLQDRPTIIIHRADFQKLKAFPKPSRDQLIILLSTDMGFRSGEVANARIENVDAERGQFTIIDSKKDKPYPIPLTYDIARLIDEVRGERKTGWLIQAGKHNLRYRGKPLTTIALCYRWKYWSRKAGIPEWNKYTPTLGRHYFASEWVQRGGNLEVLRRIMRHKSLVMTQVYLQRLVLWEDVKAEYDRIKQLPNVVENQSGPLVNSSSDCIHFEVCKLATEGCYCNRFLSKEMLDSAPQKMMEEFIKAKKKKSRT